MLHNFQSTCSSTVETLLTEFCSVDDICNKPIEELIDIIVSAIKNRFKEVYDTAIKVQEDAKSSFKLPSDMNNSIILQSIDGIGSVISVVLSREFVISSVLMMMRI